VRGVDTSAGMLRLDARDPGEAVSNEPSGGGCPVWGTTLRVALVGWCWGSYGSHPVPHRRTFGRRSSAQSAASTNLRAAFKCSIRRIDGPSGGVQSPQQPLLGRPQVPSSSVSAGTSPDHREHAPQRGSSPKIRSAWCSTSMYSVRCIGAVRSRRSRLGMRSTVPSPIENCSLPPRQPSKAKDSFAQSKSATKSPNTTWPASSSRSVGSSNARDVVFGQPIELQPTPQPLVNSAAPGVARAIRATAAPRHGRRFRASTR